MKELKPHHYKIILRDISEGNQEGFSVDVPAFHAYCYGDSIEGALESYYIYFEDEKERRKKEGIPMPKPDAAREKTKQVPLRLPESTYEKLAAMAKEHGTSFNRFVVGVLEGIGV